MMNNRQGRIVDDDESDISLNNGVIDHGAMNDANE